MRGGEFRVSVGLVWEVGSAEKFGMVRAVDSDNCKEFQVQRCDAVILL